MVDVMALGMIVSVVSFLGFVVENIWLATTKGYIDNKGMRFPLYSFFQKQNFIVLCIATVLLLTLMVIDFIYNACRMYKVQGMVRIWRIDIGKADGIRNKVKSRV